MVPDAIFKSQKHSSHTSGGSGGIVAPRWRPGILEGRLGGVTGNQLSKLCRAHIKRHPSPFI